MNREPATAGRQRERADGAQLEPSHREFLKSHRQAILATGRRDGSPQQSMIGYYLDSEDRIVISAKSYTAKWHNAVRQPRVSLTVPDGREHLVVYGTAETIADDPLRSELTADLRGQRGERPDPAAIAAQLDKDQRTIIRITPERVYFQD